MTVPETLTPGDVAAGLAGIVSTVVGAAEAAVTPQARFADLEVDSLSMIEIMLAVEDSFGVRVPDGDLGALVTVQDAVDCIVRAGSAR
jgi:acyl carrier protein